MTAPLGCVAGALWAVGILSLQSKAKFHSSSKLFRVLALAQWTVPAFLATATAVAYIASGLTEQAEYERKKKSMDAALFRVVALKIHNAEISYFRDHGAFTSDGPALGLKELHWEGIMGGESRTFAGGHTIILQKLLYCTPGSCLLRALPLVGEPMCVTVDGRIIPDSDKTVREHVTTTGEETDGSKGCVPAIAH